MLGGVACSSDILRWRRSFTAVFSRSSGDDCSGKSWSLLRVCVASKRNLGGVNVTPDQQALVVNVTSDQQALVLICRDI